MPGYDNAILYYELRLAQFSMNAAGTQTITVPDSVRTLTASDLVVTGGTISNFTKVR